MSTRQRHAAEVPAGLRDRRPELHRGPGQGGRERQRQVDRHRQVLAQHEQHHALRRRRAVRLPAPLLYLPTAAPLRRPTPAACTRATPGSASSPTAPWTCGTPAVWTLGPGQHAGRHQLRQRHVTKDASGRPTAEVEHARPQRHGHLRQELGDDHRGASPARSSTALRPGARAATSSRRHRHRQRRYHRHQLLRPGQRRERDDADVHPRQEHEPLDHWSLSAPTNTYNGDDHPSTYDCGSGNIYIEGTVKGRVTIALAEQHHRDQRPALAGDGRGGAPTGTDMVGLVSGNSVVVYHPVSRGTSSAATSTNNKQVPGRPRPALRARSRATARA